MTSLFNRLFGNILLLLIDVVIAAVAYLISYVIRFYPDLGSDLQFITVQHVLGISLIYLLVFVVYKIHRIMWIYSNVKDIYRLVLANLSAFILFIAIFKLTGLNFSFFEIIAISQGE